MISRADAYIRAGLVGSLTLLALFAGIASGINFSLNALTKAVDSVPTTVGQALQESSVVDGVAAVISLIKNPFST